MSNFQDLPDELVLIILKNVETKDLIPCGQVSQRMRKISQEGSLWVTANLRKRIVKTELLEMVLSKGCKILNISDSTIVGSLTLSKKSQLRVLNFSQSTWTWPPCTEKIKVLQKLLFSCCSLQSLEMERLCLTPTMAINICKNGKTLEKLNLNYSVVQKYTGTGVIGLPFGYPLPNNYLQEIFRWCQKLKEVDLDGRGLSYEDQKFLLKNISPNIEKLNLSSSFFTNEDVNILLSRCNKIKVLSLDAKYLNNGSLTNIRQHLSLTLEELSLGSRFVRLSFNDFLELKSMPRLKILNLYNGKEDAKEIQSLREHLPLLKINGFLELRFMQRLKILNLYNGKEDAKEIQNLRDHLPHLKINGFLN